MSDYYNTLSDEVLFDFVKNGDAQAYTILYERFKRPLVAFAIKKMGYEEAEDVVQDLWTKLWNDKDSIAIKGKFVSYIFSALRHRLIDRMARSANAQRYLDSLETFTQQFDLNTTDFRVREQLFWNQVDQILSRYGSRAQQIIQLKIQGYNNHEIAEKLQISEKTVRNQSSAIIKYLRPKLRYFLFFLFY